MNVFRINASSCSVSVRWFSQLFKRVATPAYRELVMEIKIELMIPPNIEPKVTAYLGGSFLRREGGSGKR